MGSLKGEKIMGDIQRIETMCITGKLYELVKENLKFYKDKNREEALEFAFVKTFKEIRIARKMGKVEEINYQDRTFLLYLPRK